MATTTNVDKPKRLLLFSEEHEGYWTGDCECSCFNSISPHNAALPLTGEWFDACTYIKLSGLKPDKKYRVKLNVEAEEIL